MKKIICLSICLFAGSVNASLLDFEGMSTYSSTYSIDGYDFDFNFSGWFIDQNNSYNHNGTTVLSGQGSNNYVDISFTDSAIFYASMFDASIMHNAYMDGSITVTGYFSGGGTIATTFALSDIYNNFLLAGFSGLTSIRFSENGGSSSWLSSAGISIDNIQFNPSSAPGDTALSVPEPASLVLLGLGLAGIVFSRKEKKS